MSAVTLPVFHPGDSATWPASLHIDHIAAIYDCSAASLRKALMPSATRVCRVPLPERGVKPYRWRKADIVRDREGARMVTKGRP